MKTVQELRKLERLPNPELPSWKKVYCPVCGTDNPTHGTMPGMYYCANPKCNAIWNDYVRQERDAAIFDALPHLLAIAEAAQWTAGWHTPPEHSAKNLRTAVDAARAAGLYGEVGK